MRPVSTPTKVFYAGGDGVVTSSTTWGRVVEVNFRQGQPVRQGHVLLRLDVERLDNDIAKRTQAIEIAEEELARIGTMQQLLERQSQETKAQAEAELVAGRQEVDRAHAQQSVDVRLARVELEVAQDEEARQRLLLSHGVASEVAHVKAAARLRQAREGLAKARLPVDEGRLAVLRQGLALAERDYQLKREELELRRTLKQGELTTARTELANLELERDRAVIRSPVDGVVTSQDIHVGDVLQAGQAAAEIAEQSGFRFDAVVPNEEMAHLAVGMPARIKLEAYDYQKYGVLNGTVRFISPDSGLPEGQQAPSYIVRIELKGDEVGHGELRGRVKLGMAGYAEIVSDQEGILSLALRSIRRTISLG